MAGAAGIWIVGRDGAVGGECITTNLAHCVCGTVIEIKTNCICWCKAPVMEWKNRTIQISEAPGGGGGEITNDTGWVSAVVSNWTCVVVTNGPIVFQGWQTTVSESPKSAKLIWNGTDPGWDFEGQWNDANGAETGFEYAQVWGPCTNQVDGLGPYCCYPPWLPQECKTNSVTWPMLWSESCTKDINIFPEGRLQ